MRSSRNSIRRPKKEVAATENESQEIEDIGY